jgi:NAD(P)H dehydrogenase (quinone)
LRHSALVQGKMDGMTESGLIAVTAATGVLGGRVARRLAAAGVAQRLVVRDAARAPELPAAEVVTTAGYADADGMRAALAGVGTLFLVSATEAADRVGLHTAAVDAAVAAGVGRIVYVSFVGAGPYATFTFARDHWHTEEHIRNSGVPHTVLRNNLYLDILPYFPGTDGVLRGPAGTGKFGGVARDDIADVAAAVLTTPGHEGATYDVTGPAAITMDEAAAELTRASGRLITYDAETLDQAYASRAGFGAPDWEVAGWVTSYSAVAVGELDVVSSTVRDLAGHDPMSFRDYLERNPDEVARLRT